MTDECGAFGGMTNGRINLRARRKTAPVPLCPPQIPHHLTGEQPRPVTMGSRRLITYGKALMIYIRDIFVIGSLVKQSSNKTPFLLLPVSRCCNPILKPCFKFFPPLCYCIDRLCGLVVRIPGYQIFWEVVGLERGPLSLVMIIEELFKGNSGSGIENRN
jgi:hypothetical protein